MAIAIVTNDLRLTKLFNSKIKPLHGKKDFSMMVRRRSILDVVSSKQRMAVIVHPKRIFDLVSSKQRLSIPFSYKWLRFKTGFFGLVLKKGLIK